MRCSDTLSLFRRRFPGVHGALAAVCAATFLLAGFAYPVAAADGDRKLDPLDWTFRDEHLREIAGRLDGSHHHRLNTKAMEGALRRVDARSLQSGLVGTDMAGVHPGP